MFLQEVSWCCWVTLYRKMLDFCCVVHVVVCFWIKDWAFKGWVNTAPLLHQSFYACIHPSVHPWALEKHSHSWGSGVAVICVTTTWCCRNEHIPDIPRNLCELCVKVCVKTGESVKTNKNRWKSGQMYKDWRDGVWEMWKRERTREAASRRWENGRMWGKQRRGEKGKGRRRRWRNVRGKLGGSSILPNRTLSTPGALGL